MRFIICFVLAIVSSPVFANELKSCDQYLPIIQPSIMVEASTEVCHSGYVLLFDNTSKIPVWVSWTLDKKRLSGTATRSNAFRADPLVPNSAKPKDYAASGYDKGHMSPDKDNRTNIILESESFFMTNMTPQLPSLNRGSWKVLEGATRGMVIDSGHTFQIISGPIYSPSGTKIGQGVIVPQSFYKILVDVDTKEVHGYIYEQNSTVNDYKKHEVKIEDIEKATGIKFSGR